MNLRNLAITGVIILALLAGYAALSQGGAMNGVTGQPAGKPEAISYSQLVQRVNAGEVDGALEDLAQALRIAPEAPGLLVRRGLALMEARRAREAEDAFRAVLHDWPEDRGEIGRAHV